MHLLNSILNGDNLKDTIMKKIYYLILGAVLAMAVSCQKPQFIEPTVDRQGITSLTAYFTTGKYVDQELAKLNVTD